jgi:hypothetical protein
LPAALRDRRARSRSVRVGCYPLGPDGRPGRRRAGRTLREVAPPGVEPLWPARLRWRMKGAWLWPAFVLLTPLDALVLSRLPFYGTRGPGDFAGGIILAGALNLVLVAVAAPLAARLLRRRRRDLPRIIAQDTAGTRLLLAAFVVLTVAGIVHRPVVHEEARDRAAQLAAVHDYVVRQAPGYTAGLAAVDALRLEPDMYRTCVPGRDPRKWLCLIVHTDQEPAGVKLDHDQMPNSVYRLHGGFT